jgi:hypothetical protein
MNEFSIYICEQCLVNKGIGRVKFPRILSSFEGECKICGKYTKVFNEEEVKNQNRGLI